jgi:hypothetical protein
MNGKPSVVPGGAYGVDAFLAEMAAVRQLKPAPGSGRMIFALDATASREPTWRRAARLQAQMFEVAAEAGWPYRSAITRDSTASKRCPGTPRPSRCGGKWIASAASVATPS